MVPDVQMLQDGTYSQSRRYVYKEQGTKVARSARIKEEVVLGRGTTIDDDAEVSCSIIGRDVKIGKGVIVQDSHVWRGIHSF